jgi:hypothetical protein
MVEREKLRVSDSERQAAVERLRLAHDEGRLNLDEYDTRLGAAYASVTYADLDRLFDDLPTAGLAPVVHRPAPVAPAARAGVVAERDGGAFARMPLTLKILWINYAAVVAINVTVWLLVSLGSEITYFWPMWLLIPGAALFTVTAGIDAHRRSR